MWGGGEQDGKVRILQRDERDVVLIGATLDAFHLPNTPWKVIPEFLRQTSGPFSVGGDFIKTRNADLTVERAVNNEEEDIG